MGIRRKARESALQILYEMDLTGSGAEKATSAFCASFKIPEQAHDFCLRLVKGVDTHRGQIDTLVNGHSEHWRLNRMSRVDRNILRLAAFELLYCDDIPPKVTINEAVELGKKFGTEDSGPFINGILDAISHQLCQGGSDKT
ncbi:MAG: transcription antitermination factor NusB [Thermodesulfobacteriota bacterium]|nr:transcription antitermination factor NusB [Thermodesulfobacteriota bacterium]